MNAFEIAQTIDHAVLYPTAGTEDLEHAVRMVEEWQVFSLCVKPCHTGLASKLLNGTDVKVSTVLSFPHGNTSIPMKKHEALEILNEGADEIDMVINQAEAKRQNWSYLRDEIGTINKICVDQGALLKVIFENDFISNDEVKVGLCKICTELKVGFVKTSTGFGYTKQENGDYNYKGATVSDIQLMLDHTSPPVRVKASGGIRDLETAMMYLNMGVSRLGTSSTIKILAEAIEKQT